MDIIWNIVIYVSAYTVTFVYIQMSVTHAHNTHTHTHACTCAHRKLIIDVLYVSNLGTTVQEVLTILAILRPHCTADLLRDEVLLHKKELTDLLDYLMVSHMISAAKYCSLFYKHAFSEIPWQQ